MVSGGRLKVRDGSLRVPTAGLGVTLDRDALARLHDNHLRCGIRHRDDLAQMRKYDPPSPASSPLLSSPSARKPQPVANVAPTAGTSWPRSIRRSFVAGTWLGCGIVTFAPAVAQRAQPTGKAITYVVPFPPGGNTDTLAP